MSSSRSSDSDFVPERPLLKDLLGMAELQDMQDSFSEVASLPMRAVGPGGEPLTSMSQSPALCQHALETSAAPLSRLCLPTFLGGDGIVDEELSYECMPGLLHYLVPLKIQPAVTDKALIVGYMVVGPVILMKRREKSYYAPVAEQFGISLEDLWSQVLELRVLSYKGIHSFLDMVSQVTNRILTLSYTQKMLRGHRSLLGAAEKVVVKASLLTDLREFLELFLDLALDITNGSRGSVMLLDRKKRTLSIRASHGIPTDVVSSVSVKVGEGVSGLAVEMKRAFLIHDTGTDPIVAERLHQPQLFSSLVVPIKRGEDVLGVVNIASDRSVPVQFDDSSLAILSRAAGLAGVALQRFQN
jgi:ligand-binding sensor protein